jgi:tight adherence protein B
VTVAWGLILGAGLLLVASPFLWPAAKTARRSRIPMANGIRIRLAHAGLQQVAPLTFVAASIIFSLAVGAICFALLPVVPLAVVAAVIALVLPGAIVNMRAKARRKATRVLWPDVVDQLVSSVRSGQALPDGIAGLASTGPPLTREPFARFETDYAATGNFGLCVTELKERLADPAADRILETLRMSREVGGSELTEVLRNLATYLRQETAIRSEVEARQSWVMNAARLGVAAPWVVLLLLSTRPEAAFAYNSAPGAVLIVGGLGVTIVAYRIMIAIGRLPEERRWFQ